MRQQRKLSLPVFLFACVFSLHTPCQETSSKASENHGQTTVLKTSTQLVVVDVVVQDSNGNAVRGLKADSFRITENKGQQSLRQFEEHNTLLAAQPVGKLDLPPGVFTNYTAVNPNAPLNVLLLDMINTQSQDQLFVRNQLKEYVSHADPNARVAIMGMVAGKLIMLQSFTTDPRILKAAVENKLNTRSSTFLDNASTLDTRAQTEQKLLAGGVDVSQGVDTRLITEHLGDTVGSAGGNTRDLLMQLQSQAETQSFQTSLRMQETLETFDQLALYLASLPGRKNLIWFSGSFPLSIMPDATIPNPFSVVAGAEKEYREMTNLMTRAQVAIYPIEAAGLTGPSDVDVSQVTMGKIPGHNDPQPLAPSLAGNAAMTPLSNAFGTQVDNHVTMEKMADDTGGRATYNTNNLSSAVKRAVDEGANYYTIAYSPTDHNWDSRYRSIHVDVVGAPGLHLKLNYRRGYYADDPSIKPSKNTAAVTQASKQATTSTSRMRTALTFGAPQPSDLIIKAKIVPASFISEVSVAAKNRLSAGTKGPFRRYSVDIAAIPRLLTWETTADGKTECSAEIGALVYNREGHLLNSVDQPFHYKVSPAEYQALTKEGAQLHLEISAPAVGESYIRLAIHDFNSDKFGAIEVPTSVVKQLTPSL